jgi:hypothetical protein
VHETERRWRVFGKRIRDLQSQAGETNAKP